IVGVITAVLYRFSGRDIIDDMWYSPFGKGLLTFTCSQLAIQLGMMWPLSAVYFYRFPIAGFYANFFAIPLIGWIVQLGWIAGLLDIIFGWIKLPFVIFSAKTLGELFSLFVNAFNWQLSQMFLGVAKTWSGLVPYPFTEMFSTGDLVLWYFVIFLFILHEKIIVIIKEAYLKYKKIFISMVAIIIATKIFVFALPLQLKHGKLKVIFFDSGFGNAVFVRTPRGRNILIDGGSDGTEWNFGKTTIGATLSKYKIKKLHIGILTSLIPRNAGGFSYIVGLFPIKKIFVPVKNDFFIERLTYHEFLSKINDWQFLYNPYQLFPMKIYLSYYDFLRTQKKVNTELYIPKQNETIYEEDNLKIVSLTPFEKIFDGSKNDFKNNYTLVLKITYGEKSIILPTQIAYEGQKQLCEIYKDKLKSDIMLVPCNGSLEECNSEFIDMVSPEFAICQYGWAYEPDFFSEDLLIKTERIYKNRGIKFLRTDKTGAVIFEIDDKNISMKTVLPYESI
ncbi:MAG: ComEC/Rec2 family competence protein, partial [Endomicrobiia bacterium]